MMTTTSIARIHKTYTAVLEIGCGDCELIFPYKTRNNDSGDERCSRHTLNSLPQDYLR